MKTIAAISANLETTPIGTRSRLADELAGVPLLRRTVERLRRCTALDAIVVAAPKSQADRVSALLDGLDVAVRATDAAPPPYGRLVAAARKWSLSGWRGGLGGCCAFDEYTDTPLLAKLVAQYAADAVVVAPPGAAFIDADMTDAMVRHYESIADQMRMTFAQSPPGLLPIVLQASVVVELAQHRATPGWLLSYKPDEPRMDLAFKQCCFQVPQAIRRASGRLTGDTHRSMRAMQSILEQNVELSAQTLATWLIEQADAVEPLPREVEIELTTDDPLPDTLLRPRGRRVPRRGPIDLRMVESVARELAGQDDDALVVLGGFGDPTLHPQFTDVLSTLRSNGIYGIAVNTTGQRLTDEIIQAMIEHAVDVVVVYLDAWTAETYARLNGGDYTVARDAIQRISHVRHQANQPSPIVVPQMTKCRDNLDELSDFYDGWMRTSGCAVITGYSRFGGRLDERSVLDTTPPTRHPCLRLNDRCVVLADGTVVACDQDCEAQNHLGHLANQTLKQVWTHQQARQLREDHHSGQFENRQLCAQCVQWHRP